MATHDTIVIGASAGGVHALSDFGETDCRMRAQSKFPAELCGSLSDECGKVKSIARSFDNCCCVGKKVIQQTLRYKTETKQLNIAHLNSRAGLSK